MARSPRVILDTNVLISGIAYPGSIPGKILATWRFGALEVISSVHILEETRRVLCRLNHRHRLTPAEIDDLVDILSIQSEMLEPRNTEDIALRDVNDFPVLGTLMAALADGEDAYLVTGDKDPLVLHDRYPIITPANLWKRFGSI